MLLVTGASGYLAALCCRACAARTAIHTTTRALSGVLDESVIFYDMSSYKPPSATLFEGVSAIIHCAGIAHRRAAGEYTDINVSDGELAQATLLQISFVSSAR